MMLVKLTSAPGITASSALPRSTSLGEKLLNIFVSPGEVFDEVIAAPRAWANWRLPALLLCLAGIISIQMARVEHLAAGIPQLTGTVGRSNPHAGMSSGGWPLVA